MFTKVSFVGLLLLLAQSSFAGVFEALPEIPPIPSDNQPSVEKIALGKKLYFDPKLSKTGKVSCNTCHNANSNGTDNLQFSVGINQLKGGRNAPTVLNAAYLSVQFWDGRANSLEEQAKGPMINPVEMGMADHNAVVKVVASNHDYQSAFKKAFPNAGGAINIDLIVKAIAAFERTLITPNSPFDRYMKGDQKALTEAAVRGMDTVQKVGCVSCHMGPMFAGPTLPMGQGFYQKFPLIPGSDYEKKYKLSADQGRFEVTKNEADRHMFRVPTWRNVAETAPYFHNGSVKTLDEAVRVMAKTQLNRELTKNEVSDIVEFLKSLSGRVR